MAQTATTTNANRSLVGYLIAPFAAIGRGLVAIAEAGPRMQQVRRLNEMSDDDLAALGVTRAEMVRKIFGGSIYL
ncbi:DUF1127 domain-containing protein [Limimaricola cinnabarinus]|jgi:hypothetical protein|uniref:DUF1127 domain-containing protein n=1 Tax=Limimaricola cinnabarinus LL-001 TaxID=1337093 RepID=U2YQC7_9RHOB|nr:DUF1127 domain-containing protein [Limimaricola cinnabarinus]GAD57636.1 hypothetical protein MBELCI_3688 [Limimaricola cinnabarinus LL-001]